VQQRLALSEVDERAMAQWKFNHPDEVAVQMAFFHENNT
jgi:hypothetical protein